MDNKTLLTDLKKLGEHVNSAMQEDLRAIANPLLHEVLQHAIFQGGKRIRPLLTYLSAWLIESSPGNEIWKLAMTFEYLHAASLLHDDVIDRSEFRRGKPTANKIWGEAAVILAGDYLHARAMAIAGTIGGPECIAMIGEATGAMVEAEFLQMQIAQKNDTDEGDYFAVLQGKTAALIAAACELGIFHAGGSSTQRDALKIYGTNLGLAFQIVDDLLDYKGDPEKTGKAVGNDFAEGKMTLPLIHALVNTTGRDADFLRAMLEGSREDRERELKKAAEIIETSGGFSYAAAKAKKLMADALGGLMIFEENHARQALFGLAEYVLAREK